MSKVVVLDLDPGDVLVFKTDHELTATDINEWVSRMKTALGVEVLLVGSDIDFERWSAKRVDAIRRMFADPHVRSAMEQVTRALRPITEPAPRAAPWCGIMTGQHVDGGLTFCDKPLDDLDRCEDHGSAWVALRGGTRR